MSSHDTGAAIAHRQYIATRIQRRFGASHDTAHRAGSFHGQIVGKHHAAEIQFTAQYFGHQRREKLAGT